MSEAAPPKRKWSVNGKGIAKMLGQGLVAGIIAVVASKFFEVAEKGVEDCELLFPTESLHLDPHFKKVLKRLEPYGKYSPHDYKGCIDAAELLLLLEHTLGRKKVEIDERDVPRIVQAYKMGLAFLESLHETILLNANNEVKPKDVPEFKYLRKQLIELFNAHVFSAIYLASLQ